MIDANPVWAPSAGSCHPLPRRSIIDPRRASLHFSRKFFTSSIVCYSEHEQLLLVEPEPSTPINMFMQARLRIFLFSVVASSLAAAGYFLAPSWLPTVLFLYADVVFSLNFSFSADELLTASGVMTMVLCNAFKALQKYVMKKHPKSAWATSIDLTFLADWVFEWALILTLLGLYGAPVLLLITCLALEKHGHTGWAASLCMFALTKSAVDQKALATQKDPWINFCQWAGWI